jgi:long-chain acyl-CoA synthetase
MWDAEPVILEYQNGKTIHSIFASDLSTKIKEAEQMLRGFGILKGQIVFLFLNNSIDSIIILLALLHLEAVLAPLSLAYRKFELQELFRNACPQAIICEESHLSILSDYLNERIVIKRTSAGFRLLFGQQADLASGEIDPRTTMILYTYRGYGFPLGAMIGEDQLLHGTDVLQEGDFKTSRDRILVVLPLSHIFSIISCLLFPILYKMTLVISPTLNPRVLFELVSKHQITHISAVPELYLLLTRIQKHPNQLPALRTLICGGSMLSEDDCLKIREALSAEVLHGYGLTELAPLSRNIRGHVRAGTVGTICRGIECRIANPDEFGIGEITFRSPYSAKGYLRRPGETEQAFAQGWFHTGDLGKMDAGYLVFTREKKRTRKINGSIVDLEEVRRAILEYPSIQAVEIFEEQAGLAAKVILRYGKLDRETILSIKLFLREMIADYKIPVNIIEG